MQDKKKLAEAERAAKEAQEVAELRKTMVFKVCVGQLGMAACSMTLMHESGCCSTSLNTAAYGPLLPTDDSQVFENITVAAQAGAWCAGQQSSAAASACKEEGSGCQAPAHTAKVSLSGNRGTKECQAVVQAD